MTTHAEYLDILRDLSFRETDLSTTLAAVRLQKMKAWSRMNRALGEELRVKVDMIEGLDQIAGTCRVPV